MADIDTDESDNNAIKIVYFFSTLWWGIFLGISIVVSILLLIAVAYPLGFSVGSDAVFGILALASGIAAHLFLKIRLKRTMMISEKIPFSILYVWVPLCLYIMLVKPFE